MKKLNLKTVLALACALGGSTVATAATFSSNAPTGQAGQVVTYTISIAGDGVTTDASLRLDMPASITNVVLSATQPAAIGQSCFVTAGDINVLSPSGAIIPAGPTAYCSYDLTIAPGTPVGPITLPVSADVPTNPECAGATPPPSCTTTHSPIGVVVTSPAYTSAPAPGGTITITDPITPGATTATLTVTNTGDAGTTLNVQAPTGLSGVLSIAPNTAQAITQGSAGTTYTISCAATVDAPDSQTLSFVHDGSGAGAASPATYTVICDGSVANTPPTAALGAVVQPVAGSIGSTGTATVPVNVTGAGAPTGSLALTCTIPATGTSAFAVTAGGTRTFTAPATVGASSPDISVSCVRQAAAVTATLTCAQNATPDPDPAALTADITCPAGVPVPVASVSPSAISIVAAPSTPASGTATLSNTGTGQLDIASCTAPAGFTLTAPAAFPTSVAIGASTPLTVSCTTPAEGAPALTGNLTCQSNAPDAGGVITVPLSCSGTPLVVPAMDNMGKILLASLVIGLGLLGMALRRPA
jgi:hypothetical protein